MQVLRLLSLKFTDIKTTFAVTNGIKTKRCNVPILRLLLSTSFYSVICQYEDSYCGYLPVLRSLTLS